MFASFYSLGMLPLRRDLLNNTVKDGAMIGAVSLRSLAGISSGPVAFSGFNASRIDWTSWIGKEMSEMTEFDVEFFVSRIQYVFVLSTKADVKYLLTSLLYL